MAIQDTKINHRQDRVHLDEHAPSIQSDYTTLPADLLFQGDYTRSGDNLVIRSSSGEDVIIEGYFTGDTPPILQTAEGAALLPETVQKLLIDLNPVQVAGPAGSLTIPGILGDPIGSVDDIGAAANVTAKGADGRIRTLTEGDPIYLNDVVETVGRSFVGLRMVDDTSFQLGKETRAVIDNYQFNANTEQGKFEATVITGFFRYASGKLGGLDKGGHHSTIKTPTAQIGIRGSELEGQILRSADRVVAVSTWLADWAIFEVGCHSDRVRVVHNGATTQLGARDSTREKYKLKGLVFGFVGSFRPWHGLELIPQILDALPEATALVVGSGPVSPPTHPRLINMGRVEPAEVPDLIAAMDVAIAPYPLESPPWFCPLKIQEYLAQGVPVVATDVGESTVLDGAVPGILQEDGAVLGRTPGRMVTRGIRVAEFEALEGHVFDALLAV